MDAVWWTDAAAWYYYGNSTNLVLSGETARTALGYHLTACGLMVDADAGSVSQVATNGFGGDGFYRKHTNLLAPVAGGAWLYGSRAGVWGMHVGAGRTVSDALVGSRAVLYGAESLGIMSGRQLPLRRRRRLQRIVRMG